MKLFLGGIYFLCFLALGSFSFGQGVTFYRGEASGQFDNDADYTNGHPTANIYGEYLTGADFANNNEQFTSSVVTTITISVTGNQAAAGIDIRGLESDPNLVAGNGNGTVNFQFGSGSTLTIGNAFGPSIDITNGATFGLSGGTITTQGDIAVGDATSGQGITYNGTYEADSGIGSLTISGSTLTFANGAMYVGEGTSANGTVTESNAAFVSGGFLNIGSGGGTGVYHLQGGTLDIAGDTTLGIDSGSSATLIQTGGNFSTGTLEVGIGSTADYQFSSGNAQVTQNLILGEGSGITGTIEQTGGTMVVGGTTTIGDNGNGTYTFSSGNATFNGDLTLGSAAGSNGTFIQNNGTLIVNGTTVVGASGNGLYTMDGGNTRFNGNLILGEEGGSTGRFTQDGGTVTLASGQTLSLDQGNSVYNLNGGTFLVGDNGGTNGITGPGTFNFGGGTLEAQGSTLTDSANGTITNKAFVLGTNATVTLSGNLSGSGGLVTGGNGATVVNLTGTDTYTGGTTVNAGLLNAGLTNLPSSGPLFIAADATLNLTGAVDSTNVLRSSLSGAGTFDTGTYSLELTGPLKFTGTTNIGNGGELQVFDGTLGSFGATTGSLTVGGDTAVAARGTLNLVGTNNYTGATTINNGFTLLANSLASTVVTNNGTLGSNTATVGSIPFRVGGGAGVLNQPTGANEGTLSIRVAGTNSDTFEVGAANLFGSVKVSGFARLGAPTQYTIVQADALTTGTLNNPNTTDPDRLDAVTNGSVLLQASLSRSTTDPNDLVLNVTQLPLTEFARTPNQRAVASALDAGLASPSGNGSLFTSFDALTAGQIPGALDQLTPREDLYMRDIAFENSTFLAQRVDNFLDKVRMGFSGLDTSGLSVLGPGLDSGLGQSLGSLLAYNNEGAAPNGVNYYPVDGETPASIIEQEPAQESSPAGPAVISDSTDPRMAPTVAPPPSTSIFDGKGGGYNEFISGDVMLADLNQHSGSNAEPNAHYTAGNATAGVSFRMTSNLVAGVLFDYNHTDAKTDTQGSHLRVDSYSPGLFATYFKKGFYINGLASFGYNNYSDNRSVGFGGTNTNANSSPSGQQYVGNLDFGYDFHPDRHWTVGPTLGVEYTHLDVDSFQENGAGPADLNVASQGADSLRARIGGRVMYQIRSGSILFQPNFTAQFQHEFLNNPFDLDSQLSVPGTPAFAIQGTNPGRDSGLIGVGLTATLDNSLSLYLDYLAEIGGTDYFVQSVEGGLKASF